MNDQLQAKLVEILSSIESATRAAGDFALEQLPEIAQSYVLYGRASTTLSFVMCLCVTITLFYIGLIRGVFNTKAVEFGNWKESRIFCAVLGSALGIVSLIPLYFRASEMLLVWLAPKLWLLKEIVLLIK